MPLYEYQCSRCGKRFERIHKFSDPPEAPCLGCGGRAHRLLSLSAVQFKGSGWTVTDYARKSAPGEKSESKAEGEKASEAGEAKKTPAAAPKESA